MQRPAVSATPNAGLVVTWQGIDKLASAVLLILLGLRMPIMSGVTIGAVAALGLAPVWLPSLLRRRDGVLVAVSAGVAAAMGLALTMLASSTHSVSRSNTVSLTFQLVTLVSIIGAALWGRSHWSWPAVGTFFGLGLLAASVLGDGRFGVNPWKQAWVLPVAVLSLSAVHRHHQRKLQVAVLVVLAGLSAVFDSRSYFATFMLAATLSVWQLRPTHMSRRASWVWTAGSLGALAGLMYQLGTALLLNGWLGEIAQARSSAQVEESGSLILGGRPELEATAALFRSNPWGFGTGTAPSFTDVTVAKEGMASINYDPNNGYVERYMLGSQFELHSVLGDLWAWFGLGGLLLGGIILVVCTRGISRQLAARTAGGLTLFLVWWSLWNLAFSPVESSVPTLALAIALLANGPEPQEAP